MLGRLQGMSLRQPQRFGERQAMAHIPTPRAAAAVRSRMAAPLARARARLDSFGYSEAADRRGAFVADPRQLETLDRRRFEGHLEALGGIVEENRVNRRDRVLNIWLGLVLCVIVIGVVILVPNLARYIGYGLAERNARRRLVADRALYRRRFGRAPR